VTAGLQAFSEKLLTDYIKLNGFAHECVCLSGGVAANVMMNMRVRELDGVHSVFVYPNMGDGGLCVGAAALAARQFAEIPRAPHGLVFLGPAFDAEAVAAALGPELLAHPEVRRLDDLKAFSEAAAAQLQEGKIIGLYYGRMEFGPRALGHRSLLVRATEHGINATLNARLRRTEFMPFAPVTLRGRAAEAYVGFDAGDESAGRYMTMCYQTTPEMRRLCPAVVHLDGSARPQVVDERDGLYHEVVAAYAAASGIHSLVNTSFNVHEEPIVCSPADALKAFRQGACDTLGAYPFLIPAVALAAA